MVTLTSYSRIAERGAAGANLSFLRARNCDVSATRPAWGDGMILGMRPSSPRLTLAAPRETLVAR